MKKRSLLAFEAIGDDILSCMETMVNHFKDPYQTTRIE